MEDTVYCERPATTDSPCELSRVDHSTSYAENETPTSPDMETTVTRKRIIVNNNKVVRCVQSSTIVDTVADGISIPTTSEESSTTAVRSINEQFQYYDRPSLENVSYYRDVDCNKGQQASRNVVASRLRTSSETMALYTDVGDGRQYLHQKISTFQTERPPDDVVVVAEPIRKVVVTRRNTTASVQSSNTPITITNSPISVMDWPQIEHIERIVSKSTKRGKFALDELINGLSIVTRLASAICTVPVTNDITARGRTKIIVKGITKSTDEEKDRVDGAISGFVHTSYDQLCTASVRGAMYPPVIEGSAENSLPTKKGGRLAAINEESKSTRKKHTSLPQESTFKINSKTGNNDQVSRLVPEYRMKQAFVQEMPQDVYLVHNTRDFIKNSTVLRDEELSQSDDLVCTSSKSEKKRQMMQRQTQLVEQHVSVTNFERSEQGNESQHRHLVITKSDERESSPVLFDRVAPENKSLPAQRRVAASQSERQRRRPYEEIPSSRFDAKGDDSYPIVSKPDNADESITLSKKLNTLRKNVTFAKNSKPQISEDPKSLADTTTGSYQLEFLLRKGEKGYGMRLEGSQPVYIKKLIANGVAERQGVLENDRIIKINGTLVTNWHHAEVITTMQSSGTHVSLTLERDFSITPRTTAVLGMNKSDVGYSQIGRTGEAPPTDDVAASTMIMGFDDGDLDEDETMESPVKSQVFLDLSRVLRHPAHVSVFLQYLVLNLDPAPLLFILVTENYHTGNISQLARWAYEIHTTFLADCAPLQLDIDAGMIASMANVLKDNSVSGDKENEIRTLFQPAQNVVKKQLEKLLVDFNEKRTFGLMAIYGDQNLQDDMDRQAELKVVDSTLWKHFENYLNDEESNRKQAIAFSLATYFKQIGFTTKGNTVLDGCPVFLSKDKKPFKNKLAKSLIHNGHTFVPRMFYRLVQCAQCSSTLWGIAYQGYHCNHCDISVHRQCVDQVQNMCHRSRRGTLFTTQEFNALQKSTETLNKSLPVPPSRTRSLDRLQERKYPQKMPPQDLEMSSPAESPSLSVGSSNTSLQQSSTIAPSADLTGVAGVAWKSPGSSSIRSNSSIISTPSSVSRALSDDQDSDLEDATDLPPLTDTIPKERLLTLDKKERKRQDVINELIHTEGTHVRTLKIMWRLFVRPMLRQGWIERDFVSLLFPSVDEVIAAHTSLRDDMNLLRKKNPVVDDIGLVLLNRFSSENGKQMRDACAAFLRDQGFALESLKLRQRKEPRFAEYLQRIAVNPLCRKRELKDFLPCVMSRLVKYPLLIEALLKVTTSNTAEFDNLTKALEQVKELLEYINSATKECQNERRLAEMQEKLVIDRRGINAMIPAMQDYKDLDLTRKQMIYDGDVSWRLTRSKTVDAHAILFDDILLLLQRTPDDKLALKCQNANRDEISEIHMPVLKINSLIIRPNAADKKAFFLLSTSENLMDELIAPSKDEMKKWFGYITTAIENQKSNFVKPSSSRMSNVSKGSRHSDVSNLSYSSSIDSLNRANAVKRKTTAYDTTDGVSKSLEDLVQANSDDVSYLQSPSSRRERVAESSLNRRSSLLHRLLGDKLRLLSEAVAQHDADEGNQSRSGDRRSALELQQNQELLVACLAQANQLNRMVTEMLAVKQSTAKDQSQQGMANMYSVNSGASSRKDDASSGITSGGGKVNDILLSLTVPELISLSDELHHLITQQLTSTMGQDPENSEMAVELRAARLNVRALSKEGNENISSASSSSARMQNSELSLPLISNRPTSYLAAISTYDGTDFPVENRDDYRQATYGAMKMRDETSADFDIDDSESSSYI